jgi:deoxyribonuclease IV
MVRIGCHTGQADPVGEAEASGAQAVQIILGDAQSWKKPEVVTPGGPEELRTAAEKADVHVYVHAPYVINVASANNRLRIPSRKLLQQTLHSAVEVGARGVVVHGGHLTKDDDPALGPANWRKAVEGLDLVCPLFIENTAGGNHALARELSAIERLWAALDGFDVGFCLDTCHAFAGGEPLETVVPRILAITGRIDLVHANDSQGGFGSGRDRHANIGEGVIEPENLAAAVRAAAAAGASFICETPGGAAEHGADMAWIRAQIEDED